MVGTIHGCMVGFMIHLCSDLVLMLVSASIHGADPTGQWDSEEEVSMIHFMTHFGEVLTGMDSEILGETLIGEAHMLGAIEMDIEMVSTMDIIQHCTMDII